MTSDPQPMTPFDIAAELSATAADIAEAIIDGFAPAPYDLQRARNLLDTLTADVPHDLAALADIVTGHLRAASTPRPFRYSRCSRSPRKPGSSPPPTGDGLAWPRRRWLPGVG